VGASSYPSSCAFKPNGCPEYHLQVAMCADNCGLVEGRNVIANIWEAFQLPKLLVLLLQ
jgi:hypothetical protein